MIEGKVITMAIQMPRAEAIGVKDGKIAVVGLKKDVEKKMTGSTEVLELDNKVILPGFIDTHVHPGITGEALAGVDLSDVGRYGEVIRRIKKKAAETPEGKWILGFWFNSQLIKEKKYPSLKELDQISTQHPISIQHYDLHFSMVNTLAYERMGFSIENEGVEADEKGELTGRIDDPASAKILAMVGDLANLDSMITTAKEALKVGTTTMHMKEMLQNTYMIIDNLDKIPTRVKPLVFLNPCSPEILDEVIKSEKLPGRTCIALINDGSIEGHTAAFFEPYSDKPSEFGMLYYDDKELEEYIEKAHKANLQVFVHAESDRSIEHVLSVYERVLAGYPRSDHRHRIEHFEIPATNQIRRVARLGLTLGMQPIFVRDCGGPDLDIYRELVGEERIKNFCCFRSILDEGILVSGGSDTPVTKMSPLNGIQMLLTHPNEEQRITLYEALQIFTINGAKIGFEEQLKGSIEAGKYADFVVLEKDPYGVLPEKIGSINVDMTIIGGKVLHKR